MRLTDNGKHKSTEIYVFFFFEGLFAAEADADPDPDGVEGRDSFLTSSIVRFCVVFINWQSE